MYHVYPCCSCIVSLQLLEYSGTGPWRHSDLCSCNKIGSDGKSCHNLDQDALKILKITNLFLYCHHATGIVQVYLFDIFYFFIFQSGIGTLPSSANTTKPATSAGPKPSSAFSTALDSASSKSKAIAATPKPTSKSKPKPSGSTTKSKTGTTPVSKPASVSRPGAESSLKRKLHGTPVVGSKAKQKRVETTKSSSKTPAPAKTFQETRLTRANRLFVSPQTKLYCYFLHYANKLFESGNLLLQREEPCVHILHRKLNGLLKDVLTRFVKPAVITATPCTEVDYHSEENQKKDSDLMIGSNAKDYIKKAVESRSDADADHDNDLSDEDINVFYRSVRNFYITSCDYILKTWPLNDKLLQHAEILDISLRQEVSFSSLKFFIDKFPCLLGDANIDDLEVEFASYQVDDSIKAVAEAGLRVDELWHAISQVKDPSTGGSKYPLLSKCMKGILVIPHSNAMCERAFSTVRKNKTEFRPNMSVKTLESLMIEKMAHGATTCHQRVYQEKTVRRAKRATYQSLHKKSAATKPSSSGSQQ